MREEILDRAVAEGWSDEEIVKRVLEGETALFEILMRRYNQRLYRVARGILRDDAEAEDVMQDAYVRAYEHLNQFEGRAQFSTWLTRIAVHEALARLKRNSRFERLEKTEREGGEEPMVLASSSPDPEQQASAAETNRILEQAVLALPESYRVVVILRDSEQMTTAETADALELTEENVKVRLHRGRAMMREDLQARVIDARNAFAFMGSRCDRVINAVLARIAAGTPLPSSAR